MKIIFFVIELYIESETADEGDDFQSEEYISVIIPMMESGRNVTISIVDDDIVENIEYFHIWISSVDFPAITGEKPGTEIIILDDGQWNFHKDLINIVEKSKNQNIYLSC